MTLSKAKAIVAEYGLRLVKCDGEYVIRVPGNPNADYFTSDLDDALGTARMIWHELATGK
jgi:hypothetical protein